MPSQDTQTAGYRPNRQLDHIYDPVYTMSSGSDWIKHSDSHQVQRLPNYPNMFSGGRNYPASIYRTQQLDIPQQPVPEPAQIHDSDRAVVGGSDRYKFFRRPLVPFLSNFIYLKKETKAQRAQRMLEERPASPLSKTVGVQTSYRESATQTDPYSPDYILPAGITTQPEILSLATLTYGQGLPVGRAELEMIERARVKRQWEANLPPITDAASYEKRLQMLEEIELQEWAYREAEINRLQEARIEILKKVIRGREEEIEGVNRERMNKIWQKKLQERELLREKIEKKKAKILRKLAEKRKNPENKPTKRDIISEYADYGAKMPEKLREGVRNDHVGAVLPRTSHLFQQVDLDVALVEFDQTVPVKLSKPPLQKAPPAAMRKKQQMDRQLEYIEARMKEKKEREQIAKEEPPLKYLIKVQKPVQRPATPQLDFASEQDQRREEGATFLQRLLRGRLVQNSMFQGRQRRTDLINELRIRRSLQSTSNLKDIGGGATSGSSKSAAATASKSAEAELEQLRISSQDVKLEKLFETTVQAEYVGVTLDFIQKELVRLREEKRLMAMMKLAERTRKLREAEEIGTRNKEIERRQREDALFKQMMGVHQETVDTYLEDVLLQSLDYTASQKARATVQEQADKLSAIMAQQDDHAEENSEAIVTELMSSFLFPEVQRETVRHRVHYDQQRYLLAAHRAVYDALPEIQRQAQATQAHQDPAQEQPPQ